MTQRGPSSGHQPSVGAEAFCGKSSSTRSHRRWFVFIWLFVFFSSLLFRWLPLPPLCALWFFQFTFFLFSSSLLFLLLLAESIVCAHSPFVLVKPKIFLEWETEASCLSVHLCVMFMYVRSKLRKLLKWNRFLSLTHSISIWSIVCSWRKIISFFHLLFRLN